MANSDKSPSSLLDYLDSLVDELRDLVPKAIADGQTEAVHHARVATRRLKAACELLAPLMSAKHAKPFAKVGKSLRRRLGPVRDADVMLEHLKEFDRPSIAKGVAWFEKRLGESRKAAAKEAAEKIDIAPVLTKLGGWWGLRTEIAKHPSALGELLQKSIESQIAEFQKHATALAKDQAHLETGRRPDPHQLRIAGKSLRYTLEMLKAHGVKLPGSILGSFKRMQQYLGAWHDYVVLTEQLMSQSTEAMLAHHDAQTQQQVLTLATASLRKARQQLSAILRFWDTRGEALMQRIHQRLAALDSTSPNDFPSHPATEQPMTDAVLFPPEQAEPAVKVEPAPEISTSQPAPESSPTPI